ARVRVFCWGEVGKVVGVAGCGGEAAGKRGNGVMAMAGKKVSGVNSGCSNRGREKYYLWNLHSWSLWLFKD
nr:hypothetical protein [Tanacetum cinerariifolium]